MYTSLVLPTNVKIQHMYLNVIQKFSLLKFINAQWPAVPTTLLEESRSTYEGYFKSRTIASVTRTH